ncbi:MAG: hemolysin family protein [Candidatus Aegiribacteria sp.]|nr:hemolysin family protein [Candidatus Aegiribacteria sp.]
MVLLLLSAFFSGSETACFSLDRLQKRRLRRTESGRRVLYLLSSPEKLLSVILFGNTVVNITASAIAASIAAGMFPDNSSLSLGIAVGAMTFLLLVFGEISPKTLAVSRAEKWAARSSSVLLVFMRICTPIASTLSKFSKFVSGKIGINNPGSRLSREEIIALVELGQSEGLLGSEGGATLKLLTLNESQCTDVMKSRSEVAVLRTGWGEERFSEVMRSTGYTRFPVLDGPMEKVIGYVDSREYFIAGDGEPLILHDLPSFPENAPLETVLMGLRDSDEDAGAVFDEYGDWTGIVTVHDILDYFLFSSASPPGTLPAGVSVKEDWLEIPAALKLTTFSELSGKKLEARYAETCGGLILEVTGRIPFEGEEIEISGYVFRIVSREGPRLDRMEVRLIRDKETLK